MVNPSTTHRMHTLFMRFLFCVLFMRGALKLLKGGVQVTWDFLKLGTPSCSPASVSLVIGATSMHKHAWVHPVLILPGLTNSNFIFIFSEA